MKSLEVARAQVRSLVRREGAAFVAGTGLLVVGGILSVPALMFAGLILLAISRRVLAALERMRALVFGLELARDASGAPGGGRGISREDAPVVVVAPMSEPVLEPEAKGTPFAVRAFAAAAIVTVVAILASFFPPTAAAPAKRRWTFIDDSFDTGETWTIEHHAAATGGRALSKEASSPARLVATTSPSRDVRAMTRCRAEQGDGCGLAFRIADERNYSVVRVVGERVELARLEAGKESVLASSALPPGGAQVWQELTLEARGDIVRVAVNGVRGIDHHDVQPAVAGVWAPARAWFDELTIETLSASPQAVEVLPFLRRPS